MTGTLWRSCSEHGRLAKRLERTRPWRRRERSEALANLMRAEHDADRYREEGDAARRELARFGPAADDPDDSAQRLGAELEQIDDRLAPWRVIADRERGLDDRLQEPLGRDVGLER